MFFDLPPDELQTYRPQRDEPADFDAFWSSSLAASRDFPLAPRFPQADFQLATIDIFDVTFSGYLGQRVRGWLLKPKDAGPLPCIVEYVGYGGGRGFPHEWLFWSAAGYAHFVMDTRGQGSAWRHGDTPDDAASGALAPHYPGFMTQGIDHPEHYYYRRLYVDAVRAVEAARSHPAVQPDRVFVLGGSQGGGLALAVAGLVPDLSGCVADVPFLCHFRRAVGLAGDNPYPEIVRYLRTNRHRTAQTFETLSYFDGMNFAARAHAPALFSTGLMDTVCPPSTVFAAYNHYAGEKRMRVWPYNEHEGGGAHQQLEQLAFVREVLG